MTLVFPMAAMVLLTSVIAVYMFVIRVNSVRTGRTRISVFKTFSEAPTDEAVAKTGRHFMNLFETPVLFYTACLAGMVLPVPSPFYAIWAWVFVFLRLIHAWIHIGRNNVRHRALVFAMSWIPLWAMWILLTVTAANLTR